MAGASGLTHAYIRVEWVEAQNRRFRCLGHRRRQVGPSAGDRSMILLPCIHQPSQTAEPGSVAITMLSNDHAFARCLAQYHQSYEVSYVAVLVFGRPEATLPHDRFLDFTSRFRANQLPSNWSQIVF